MRPLKTQWLFFFLVCVVILLFGACTNEEGAEIRESSQYAMPSIDVWYGGKQIFGSPGMAQQWMNIPGNVSELHGVDRLSFSLNGMNDTPLSIGPDGRRLVAAGDFNVEIGRDKLKAGLNSVIIHAFNNEREVVSQKVFVEYQKSNWPLPYSINWGSVSNLQEVVQIVDGLWIVDRGGIRTHPDHVGYDRVIAIGDRTWKDYEVTVSFTIHAMDASAYDSRISKQPAFGITMRWTGHTDTPVKCAQPHCGWTPFGGSFWYKFRKDNDNGWRIVVGPTGDSTDPVDVAIHTNRTYWIKARVKTETGGDLYQLKVWEDEKENEPAAWMLEMTDTKPKVSHGAFLLVAHHVDVTFGNVGVVAVDKD